MPKRKKREHGEGNYEQLPSGSWRASLPGLRRAGSSKTFPTRQEAIEWLRANAGTKAVGPLTLGEWLTEWLAQRKPNLSPKAYQFDELRVRTVLIPRLGTVRLRDLDAGAIANLLADLDREGQSADYRHKVGRVLRAALNTAVEHKRLDVAPKIRLSKPKTKGKRILTVAEIAGLLKAGDRLGFGHWLRFWIDSGARPQELFALLWDDFDLEAGTVRIVRALEIRTHTVKDTKTKHSRRTLDLGSRTVAALKAARPADYAGKLFLPDESGRHLWFENFRRGQWKRLLKAAKLTGTGVIYYSFRHTMATHLLSRGINPLIVSRRLGHSNVTTVYEHYADVLPDDQAKAAAVMDAIIGGK